MPPKQGHAQPEVALIFPPATDPRSPHLALPSLTAALRGLVFASSRSTWTSNRSSTYCHPSDY